MISVVPVFLTLFVFLSHAVSYRQVFRHFPSFSLAMSSSQEGINIVLNLIELKLSKSFFFFLFDRKKITES